MRILFAILSVLVAQLAFGASFDEIEAHLRAGEYGLARAEVEVLYKDRSVVTTPKVKRLKDYENLIPLLEKADQFESAAGEYLSAPNARSLMDAERAFSSLVVMSKQQKQYRVSGEIIELLNAKMASANKKIATVRDRKRETEELEREARQKAEAARKQKEAEEEAHRKAEYAERERKWKEEEAARLAKLEREEKAREEKEAAEKRKQEEQRRSIGEKAKAAGYTGLHERGIARFLYKVKHGGSLEEGLGYVFWSGISDNEKRLDAKFEATQLIDGMVLYSLVEYTKNETIDFTIMVPDRSGGMFLEGQRLRDSCHTYTGNGRVTTVLGVERIIPIFEPLDKEICQ